MAASASTTIVTCPNCGAKNRVDERAGRMTPVCGRCGVELSLDNVGGHPITVTDATFSRDVLGVKDKPVLLDCWAPWCGPCRMLGPTIDQLAGEANGRYVVGKLNTDENPGVASQFRISSIPAMLIFKNGKLVDTLVGLQPKTVIAARLAALA